ncbi:MAG: hypothetical protein S4CHLAM37_03820 [Chlamydiia bacterium]|nr:hypothetical protein [Chlamydiia bacterium]
MAVKVPAKQAPWRAQVSDVLVGSHSVAQKDASGRGIAMPGSKEHIGALGQAIDTTVQSTIFNKLLDGLEAKTGKKEFDIEIRYIGNEVKFFQVLDSGKLEELKYDSTTLEEKEVTALVRSAAAVDAYAQSYIQATAPIKRKPEHCPDGSGRKLSGAAQQHTRIGDAKLKKYHAAGLKGQGLSPKVKGEVGGSVGIENGSLYCYANSATQMLRHIPSLKAAVTDKAPEEQRRALLEGKKGADIVSSTRKLMGGKPADKLPSTKGQDAGEFLGVYLDRVSSDLSSRMNTGVQLTREYESADESKEPLTRKDPVFPTSTVQLPMSSATGKHASFFHGLHVGLNESTTKDTDLFRPEDKPGKAYKQTGRKYRFTEPVRQIFFKPQRFREDGTKDQRAITDVPYVLDLRDAMAEGVEGAKPLELKGFTVHSGSGLNAVGGHYISYFQKDGKWYYANDKDVYEVSDLDQVKYASMYAADLYYDDELSELGQAEITRISAEESAEAEKARKAEVATRSSPKHIQNFFDGTGSLNLLSDTLPSSYNEFLAYGDEQAAGFKDGSKDPSTSLLETRHNYIQYLFPTTDRSATIGSAAQLSVEDVRALRASSAGDKSETFFLKVMLPFYGFEIQTNPSGQIVNFDLPADPSKLHWLQNPDDHNLKRITRMIYSLRLLGKEEVANRLYESLSDFVKGPAKGKLKPEVFESLQAANKQWKNAATKPLPIGL